MRFPTNLFPMAGSKENPLSDSERYANRALASDYLRNTGTGKPPSPPRDLQVQPAPRGIKVNWGLPLDGGADIIGWLIFSPDDITVADSLPSRSTRTYTLAGTAGSIIVGYVASVNAQGVRSTPVLFSATAIAEAGAPSYPSNPPGWTSGNGSPGPGPGRISEA
jgi:hypothetical protein